jgi:hypothetical protein
MMKPTTTAFPKDHFIVGPMRTFVCAKGHRIERGTRYGPGAGSDMMGQPIPTPNSCERCHAEWLAEKFPMKEETP